jgi:potassium-transporting ATPase KdpC subunit
MILNIRRSLTFAIVAIALTFAYAYAGAGLAHVAFKSKANGSITPSGSTLIGQNWTSPRWFHGRPDDAGPYAADPKKDIAGGDNPLMANGVPGESGATNLGPRSSVLLDNTRELVQYWHRLGVNPTPDLVTTSGSGYDPDIAPQDAIVQIPMVSRATGIAPLALRKLIARETHGEQWGFLGSSYIVVLQLNEALAKLR